MTIPEAFGDGFASFFSIWQVCILQVSPFFLGFVTGLYFAGYADRGTPSFARGMAVPALLFATGFCVFYALSSATALPVGRFLSYNNGTLRFVSGLYILAVSLFIALAGRLPQLSRWRRPALVYPGYLVLGIAFALVYSPCVTPALSDILGLTSRGETVVRGAFLAFFYSLGISLALGLTGAALVLALRRIGAVRRNWAVARDGGAIVLGILALLNISGLMTQYKAFVLGLLVACLSL